jgi:hypothetical protein
MIYTDPYVMLLMRATSITRASVRGLVGLEIETFLGNVKWHRVVKRVPFGAKREWGAVQ